MDAAKLVAATVSTPSAGASGGAAAAAVFLRCCLVLARVCFTLATCSAVAPVSTLTVLLVVPDVLDVYETLVHGSLVTVPV